MWSWFFSHFVNLRMLKFESWFQVEQDCLRVSNLLCWMHLIYWEGFFLIQFFEVLAINFLESSFRDGNDVMKNFLFDLFSRRSSTSKFRLACQLWCNHQAYRDWIAKVHDCLRLCNSITFKENVAGVQNSLFPCLTTPRLAWHGGCCHWCCCWYRYLSPHLLFSKRLLGSELPVISNLRLYSPWFSWLNNQDKQISVTPQLHSSFLDVIKRTTSTKDVNWNIVA